MKKLLILLFLLVAAVSVKAQSEFFCRTTVQTSVDSWNYRVWKESFWNAPGTIQINVTQNYTGGGSSSTGWQPFTNGMTAGTVGLGTSAVIEIRILHLLTGAVLYQFPVTNVCLH
ncbi:hypothetical protein [Chitinophaga dinghuensis]|nr:hypothetical protein [Chitinophaga dinghuensis]